MAQIRLDKVRSLYQGNVETLTHTADITNGLFFSVGAPTAQREVFQAVVPATANLALENFLLIAAPEVMYDDRLDKRSDFVIRANEPARALYLTKGDYITLTKDLFDGTTPVANEFVGVLNTKTKLGKVDPATYTGTLLLKVVREQSLQDANDALQLRVIKA